jgi:CheY-like chemotaxis protein
MLRRLIGEDIELKMELDPHIGRVRVDPGQIVQVLMNLAVNARDAMPSGGTLRISTAHVEQQEEATVAPYLEALSGPCVLLRVSDTGLGMDKATKARIFEPFFTTKEPGAGTGLGLATVFGIVKQSGGSIRVVSEPGQGATFEIYLPRSEEPEKSSSPTPELTPTERGSEMILLVEDNDQLRQLIRRVLEKNGYQVLDAANPQEALAHFERQRDSIHLLLTDVVMPQMSGRQLAEKLLASRRELKVLYMSGYTEDVALRHGIIEASVSFLQKPVTPQALLRKLREVLGRPA